MVDNFPNPNPGTLQPHSCPSGCTVNRLNCHFQALTPSNTAVATEIWNLACEGRLTVTQRLLQYNRRPIPGVIQRGNLAVSGNRPVGFVLMSVLSAELQIAPPGTGWIDALAVRPEARQQGVGSRLLNRAEAWLRQQGAKSALIGGGVRPWVPGLPEELGRSAFFCRRGYRESGNPVWDVVCDLGGESVRVRRDPPPEIVLEPMRTGQEDGLGQFLRREFPGRWAFEFSEFLREGGKPNDYLLLQFGESIQGFARMTDENSERPLDRFFMHRLTKPRGQIGPIGIAAGHRGQGYGLALVDAAVQELRRRGVRGCIVDWTGHTAFYGRLGFVPYRKYRMLAKELC